jgi:hypothetical protein
MNIDNPISAGPERPSPSFELNKGRIIGSFKIRSFDYMETLRTDQDNGVIRISKRTFDMLAKAKNGTLRNSFLKITVFGAQGERKSLVRIVRASISPEFMKTRPKADLRKPLLDDEIGLQYDDRVSLGVINAGEIRSIELKQVNYLTNFLSFALTHTSPSIRVNAMLSILMLLLSVIAGALVSLFFFLVS